MPLLALADTWLTGSLLRRQTLADEALRQGSERWELAAGAAGLGVFD